MTIEETQNQIIEEFKNFESWFDKRKHLIQIGKEKTFLDSFRANDANLIRGCQVSTWFYSEFRDGRMFYEIDSASAVVKGIAVLLARTFSGQSPENISAAEVIFIDGAGLREDFSPVRANSLLKMLGRIKSDAADHIAIGNGAAAAGPGSKPEQAIVFGITRLKKIYAKMRNAAR